VLEATWGAEEELLLLQAIELNGFGNWGDISQWVKTKGPLECETHYVECYFHVPSAPRPVLEVHDPFPPPPPPPFSTAAVESCPLYSHEKNPGSTKKEKSSPAEVNGYMPRRGEFEEEYNDEVEHILDGLEFDEERESQESFDQKMNVLLCYNSQLLERKARTQVVEDWQLQYGKYKDWGAALGAKTVHEQELDTKILTFAPYMGKKKTEQLASRLHDLAKNIDAIESWQQWQQNGVQSPQEGKLFHQLRELIKDGKLPEGDIGKWNKFITDFMQEHGERQTEDAKLLTQTELALCRTEQIQPPMFVALKDLLIREYAARGGLAREEALDLVPEDAHRIGAMYDLFVSMGWITD
jgi:transcriptional adapter 2-alpha